tara:strand:+ start:912 stop:2954 length:2043 start_codon:yes stop_codon:yes gene_type:complete
MPFSLSPSITITEKDLSSIIPATSNTVACFVGRFNKGPVDEIIDINSESKLYEVFGKPDPGERGVDWWTCANFLNYGDKLKVVRVDEGDGLYYGADRGLTSGSPSQIYFGGQNNNAGRTAGAKVYAKSPGSLSNSFRLVLHPATTSKFEDICSGQDSSGSGRGRLITFGDEANMFSYHPTSTPEVFNSYEAGILTSGATQDEVHYALIDNTGLINEDNPGVTGAVLEKFEGLSMWKGVYDSTGRNLYYKDYINQNSNYITIEENTHRSLVFGNQELGVHNASLGANGNTLTSVGGDWGSSTGGDPTWTPTTTTMPHPLGSGLTAGYASVSFSNGKVYRGVTAAPLAWNAVFSGGAESGVTFAYEGGGADSNHGTKNNPHVAAIRSAYNKHFGDPEKVEIDLILGGPAEGLIGSELIELANSRKDCLVFLSPPSSPAGTEYNDIAFSSKLAGYSGPDNVISYRLSQGFNSSYAVMDSGWKYMYDSYNDKFRWAPLNADTAGLVARTEEGNAPFFSPAGLNRGNIAGVVKLAINPSKAERDRLYANSVNPVVSFPGEGTVLYGDKTLQRRTTSLDRINVRRLLTTMEKAIATAAKYQLFEFNDEFTRRSFVSTISPFLRRIQSQRGITDFRVVCDETNNTGEVIGNNQFVADIFIKPVQSTNFINLNFSVVRADATFNETVV